MAISQIDSRRAIVGGVFVIVRLYFRLILIQKSQPVSKIFGAEGFRLVRVVAYGEVRAVWQCSL